MNQTPKNLSAKIIADYFIWKSNKEGKLITNKKLQKLLYYAQAWNLVFNDRKIFKEDIEAWVHGPAIPAVYNKYKDLGANPIDKEITFARLNSIPEKEKRLLGEVWRVYGKYDANYLEELTHNEEPWQKAREGLDVDEASDIKIDLKLMKEYYQKRLENAKR